MGPTDAMTIARLTRERDHAVGLADSRGTLLEQTAAALKGADAEIARLRARAAAPRWWCMACDVLLVGGDACGKCGAAKPAASGRHA